MTEWHAATWGRSEEDQMAKIKEDVGPRHGIMVHLSHVMWQHRGVQASLSKTNGPDLSQLNLLYINVLSFKTLTFD